MLKSVSIHSAVLAIYLIGLLCLSWPLPVYLTSTISTHCYAPKPNIILESSEGDHIQTMLRYMNRHTMFILGKPNLAFSVVNKPSNTILDKLNYYTDPYAIPTSIFMLATGNTKAAYNLTILFWLAAGGYFMFLFMRKITGDVWIALIAGALFAFSPIRITRASCGHFIGMISGMLPLVFYCVYLLRNKFRWGLFILLGLLFWHMPEWHLRYYIIIYIFSIAFCDVILSRIQHKKFKASILSWAPVLLSMLPLIIKLLVKRLTLVYDYPDIMSGRGWDITLAFGIIWKYVLFAGGYGEKDVFIGLPLFIIAAITCLAFILTLVLPGTRAALEPDNQSRQNTGRFLLACTVVTALTLFISLGPLKFTSLYKVMYAYVPGFKFSRVPQRTIIFALIGLIAISSLFLKIAFQSFRQVKGWKFIKPALALGIVCLIYIFYNIHPYFQLDKLNFNDDILEKCTIKPYQTTALFLPLMPVNHYYTTKYEWLSYSHKLRIINCSEMEESGNYSRFVQKTIPDTVRGRFPLSLAFWMISNKVDYIIFDKEICRKINRDWKPIVNKFSSNAYLTKTAEDTVYAIFTVSPLARGLYASNASPSDTYSIEPGIDTLSQQGILQKDPGSEDTSALYINGKQGYAVYGYTIPLNINQSYYMYIRLKAPMRLPPSSLYAELFDPQENKVLKRLFIMPANTSDYQWITVPFSITETYTSCEFRMKVVNNIDLWLDEIIITDISISTKDL